MGSVRRSQGLRSKRKRGVPGVLCADQRREQKYEEGSEACCYSLRRQAGGRDLQQAAQGKSRRAEKEHGEAVSRHSAQRQPPSG